MKNRIYQICYSPETMANIPEGFSALDNLKNERPDWREFWPMRKFLRSNYLSDDVLYGFFSPKFFHKTGLSYADIQKFLKDNYQGQDVVSFSPFWDLSSIFKNVFEQGDFFHPGLADACQAFADAHLAGLDLRNSITHSQNTIFCNYFLAKKEFWMEWLELGELLFDECEKNETALAICLNDVTTYGIQKLPMKIFLQERLATVCLLNSKKNNCLAYNTFKIGPSTTFFNTFKAESVISNSLKISYQLTKSEECMIEFGSIRDSIINNLGEK